MKTTLTKREQTEKLVLMALLTAMVAILAYFGGFIKIGGFASISLTLIPVVLGAALYGPWAGAFLGFISAVIFFITPDAAFWFGLNLPGTLITVILKAVLAGLAAGLVYKLLEKINRYLSVIVAAIVCPIVNTGVFLLGCLVFFMDNVNQSADAQGISVFAFLIIFYVGLNFVFELIANIVLSPAVLRMLNLRQKKN